MLESSRFAVPLVHNKMCSSFRHFCDTQEAVEEKQMYPRIDTYDQTER